MTVDIDLGDAFKQAFGRETDAFNPNIPPVVGDMALTRTTSGALGSPYYANDLVLGTEYFMPINIKYPDLTPLNAQDSALLGSSNLGILKSYNLPFPIISITSRKTIIETPLTERRGTVKELINIQDYDITIRGFIISATNDYPEADVTTLRNIYEANVALSIKCPLTDIFLLRPDRGGSDNVVIKEFNLPGLKGVKNVVPYELKLVSDEPFNLIDIS